MKKIFLTMFTVMLALVMVGQTENYKLGDFNATQVKVKSLNLGGSWTTKKNSTSFAIDWYYGATKVAAMSTAGGLSVPTLTTTGNITTTGLIYV